MRILFIGNSHTYFNDMPHQFAELLRAKGQEVSVTMLTRGGQKLCEHIRNEQTRFNILFGGYDHVILQENTSEFPDEQTHARNVAVIKDWCDRAGAKLSLYMNFESPKDTPPLAQLRAGVLYAAEALQLPVARIGDAFAAVQQKLPHIDLYYTDRHHANTVGSYLIALVLLHDVFGLDVAGLPSRITGAGEILTDLSPEDACALQKLVQEL